MDYFLFQEVTPDYGLQDFEKQVPFQRRHKLDPVVSQYPHYRSSKKWANQELLHQLRQQRQQDAYIQMNHRRPRMEHFATPNLKSVNVKSVSVKAPSIKATPKLDLGKLDAGKLDVGKLETGKLDVEGKGIDVEGKNIDVEGKGIDVEGKNAEVLYK